LKNKTGFFYRNNRLDQVVEIADGIYKIEKEMPSMSDIFTIYFIKAGGNVIIDPGPGMLIPTILSASRELGITDFRYIIPTHVHMDHAGSCGELIKLFPEAVVVANSQGARHLIDPSRLIRSTKIAFGDDFVKTWGAIVPVPQQKVRTVKDLDRLSLDGRELVFYDVPGHAHHHIAIFDTKTQALFPGEALGLIYNDDTEPTIAATPPQYDPDTYIRSMERFLKIPVKTIFYSHGGTSTEPEKAITQGIKNIRTMTGFILEIMKNNPKEIAARKIDSYLREQFGVKLSEYSLWNNFNGYSDYFKRKGLIK
jgi:glyoxylase-like metal-dependent hydrolase (beta-lactamase superfamily II)